MDLIFLAENAVVTLACKLGLEGLKGGSEFCFWILLLISFLMIPENRNRFFQIGMITSKFTQDSRI